MIKAPPSLMDVGAVTNAVPEAARLVHVPATPYVRNAATSY